MAPSALKTNNLSLFSRECSDPQICLAPALHVDKVSRLIFTKRKCGTSSWLRTNALVTQEEE